MAVYKRGKTWHAEIYSRGKRLDFRGGFESKKEAKEWYDYRRAQIKLLTQESYVKRSYTFKNLIDEYCNIHLPTIRPSTSRRYLV